MLRKKDNFTIITPIPGFIPRQLAIDILHSHPEVITLNPLVLKHKAIPAPHNAEADEYYSTWYEITERIQFVPGIGKMGASTIKFNGCFHNMPWGLQTHIYAPMNVDLRNKYTIAGNQPGVEPPEIPEIGLSALGAPANGLYLKEDIEIKCNFIVFSLVRSQLKKASGEMVRRIIKKAELLDAGVLQAMIEDGKLKTMNPADRSTLAKSPLPSPTRFQYSPSLHSSPPPLGSPPVPYQVPRWQPGQSRPWRSVPSRYAARTPGRPQELPAGLATISTSPLAPAPVEIPGDFFHASPNLQPERPSPPTGAARESLVDPAQRPNTNPNSGSGQWSRLSSISTGLGSPGLENHGLGFSPPLAPHYEPSESAPHYPYSPTKYAKQPPGWDSGSVLRNEQLVEALILWAKLAQEVGRQGGPKSWNYGPQCRGSDI
ncbi:hypothetical protein C8A00DRAFT_46102 [Chaetomidium leptoderma]|uniref:DUF7053 domain-containing protein n=1 Tax=Chaetomidium leptoderma TaxID=669021 RepID=A0AAN6VGR7_9PEZI|nr:hypothetical protein C8A00DRAFT_46102 [Chaetomidium leptoderma]